MKLLAHRHRTHGCLHGLHIAAAKIKHWCRHDPALEKPMWEIYVAELAAKEGL